MYLLDTNILIYSTNPDYSYLQDLIMDSTNAISVISKVESLGYKKITQKEITYFSTAFKILVNHPINDAIINRTIELKQSIKIPLGDALIAATALEFNLELLTRNIKDFQFIKGLTVSNPMSK